MSSTGTVPPLTPAQERQPNSTTALPGAGVSSSGDALPKAQLDRRQDKSSRGGLRQAGLRKCLLYAEKND